MFSSLLQSGEFYSAICAVMWALAIVLFRKSGDHLSPFALNIFKNIIAIALFIITMLILEIPFIPAEIKPSDWIILSISGMIGFGVADILFFKGLNRIGAGHVAIVDCLYGPFVIILSIVMLSEPLGATLFLGIGLMILAIIIGTGKSQDSENKYDIKGIAMAVSAILLMAIAIVIAKPVIDRVNPFWVIIVRLLGGMIVLAPMILKRRYRVEAAKAFKPSKSWKISIPAAIVGAYLAMIFWIIGVKHTYATVASVINQSSTVFVFPFAAIILKEKLTLRKGVAVLLGIAGGVLAAM